MKPEGYYKRVCPVCAKSFTTQGINQITCSRECSSARRRQRTEDKYAAKLSEPIDQWLHRRYVDESATYRDIMSDLGMSGTRTLTRLLRKYKIPIRGPSEAVALQYIRNPNRRKLARAVFIANGLPPKKGEPNHAQLPGVGGKISKAKKGHPMYDRDGSWYKNICRSIQERQQKQSDTDIEQMMEEALTQADIPFEKQKTVGPYSLDFAIEIGSFKVAVECDGIYWHTKPGRKERDAERDKILSDLDWTTLRFSDRDIHHNLSHCLKIIISAITI